MSGHEGGVTAHRKPGLGLQHPQRCERDRHQGRLGIFGELQGLGRTLPDDRGQLFAERCVDLFEYRPRGREGFRHSLAHAYGLRPLARKGKCCGHFC
jgi:hypothetical protein